MKAELEELLPRLEALQVAMPYTRWEDPRPAMEIERQARNAEHLEWLAKQRANREAVEA